MTVEDSQDQAIVLWFYTSDKCEQTPEDLRIDRHAGRRTSLDCLSVVQGCKNKNKLLTLEGIHFLEDHMMHLTQEARASSPNLKKTRKV